MPRPVRVELIHQRAVEVPELGASVTLLDSKTALVRDPETGRRYHASSGTLRFTSGDRSENVAFGPTGGLEWNGRRMTVRGEHGGYELVFVVE